MKVCVGEILILLCPHTLKFSLVQPCFVWQPAFTNAVYASVVHVVKDAIQLWVTQESGATPWWVSPTQIVECIHEYCECIFMNRLAVHVVTGAGPKSTAHVLGLTWSSIPYLQFELESCDFVASFTVPLPALYSPLSAVRQEQVLPHYIERKRGWVTSFWLLAAFSFASCIEYSYLWN